MGAKGWNSSRILYVLDNAIEQRYFRAAAGIEAEISWLQF